MMIITYQHPQVGQHDPGNQQSLQRTFPALQDGEFKMLEQKVEVKSKMNTPKLLCLMSSSVRQ